MRMNVGVKLWLAFFFTITLCVLALYLLLHNSLKKGFLDYTSQQVIQRIDILRSSLRNIYVENGSFEQLKNDSQRWMDLKSVVFVESDALFSNEIANTDSPQDNQDSPQRYYREFVSSITLHDIDKNLLIGVIKPGQTLSWIPIDNNGVLVGFIGFVKPTVVSREIDRRFMQHQLKLFTFLSLLVLVISTLVATLLSRRISKPLTQLAESAQALAAGDYQRELAVTSADEIGQLCRNFNQLAQTLSANAKSRALFIADVSHEMRTPIAVLKAQIEAMQDGIRPLNQDGLALLHSKIQGLNTLIDDLFELSLSDIGALTYNKQRLCLSEMLNTCIAQFQPTALAAELTLVNLTQEKNLAYMLGDAKRLEQLLGNLFTNSIRYTAASGRIEVRLRLDPTTIYLNIDDTAPGVAEEHHEKIFERLYRLESSRNRSTGGAGLGLAICKNIVTAHQGKIFAHTSPLGGLNIQIEFPRLT